MMSTLILMPSASVHLLIMLWTVILRITMEIVVGIVIAVMRMRLQLIWSQPTIMLPHLPNRNITQSHNILSHVLFMPALNTQKQKQKSKVQNDSILPLFVYIGVTISFAISSLTLYHLCGDNLDKCIKQ